MLISLSIDHRRADLALLERIQRNTDALSVSLGDATRFSGSAMLATCNRFEVYFDSDRPESAVVSDALERISEIADLPGDQVSEAAVVRSEDEAAEHLFSVSSGLESVILGEGEIAGQVRRSLERARLAGTSTAELERLFQAASRTSREVKQRTGVQSAGRSLVRVALGMVESRIGDWGSARVLLIGTGAYAGASLAALRARGAERIGVYSSSGRAEAFARSHRIEAVEEGALHLALTEADVVVACTHTRDPLLTVEQFATTATSGRRPFCFEVAPGSDAAHPVLPEVATTDYPRPRLVIDMGVPRNVDPAVAGVPGVELLDLDLVARHAPIPELSAEAEARRIVRRATDDYRAAGAERAAAPTLVALRTHAQRILQDELSRAARNGEVDPAVESALKHLTGRLLHRPTTRLRAAAAAGRADEAGRAFELLFGDEPPAGA